MIFSDIPINAEELNQSDLNIENKTRSNLFSWNGQFSPQFVETLLKKYANSETYVLDPFLGSGTTLCECARLGIQAYGTELNASAYYMAKLYEISNLSSKERLLLLEKIELIVKKALNNEDILQILILELNNNFNYVKDTISLLIILLDLYKGTPTTDALEKKWKNLKRIIIDLPYSNNKITAQHGDARKILLNDNEIDLLITSPPYINVFNYHQKYRRSVEKLGFNVLNIAKSEFGSNRKNRGNRLLTVIQYCIDMAVSIYEASRVCKEDARMIYVVGRESTILGYSFCNSELIYEIATRIFNFDFLIRQERVFKNRYGQMIYEDILHFKNKKKMFNFTIEEIKAKSRLVALTVLKSKAEQYPTSKNIDLIFNAINAIEKVNESEVVI
ncbi:MAG: site-specific DNA-methyltransferase [Clostridiales bacterium]|nr:site-specific DNA-methyltransferase [Clostridiales bacterium]